MFLVDALSMSSIPNQPTCCHVPLTSFANHSMCTSCFSSVISKVLVLSITPQCILVFTCILQNLKDLYLTSVGYFGPHTLFSLCNDSLKNLQLYVSVEYIYSLRAFSRHECPIHPMHFAPRFLTMVSALLLNHSKNRLFLHCTNIKSLLQPKRSTYSPWTV